VLWLDETYDELNYRAVTAIHVAANASALIVAGSAGASRLGRQVFDQAAQRRASIIVIALEQSDLAELAGRQPHGIHLRGAAADLVPMVVAELAHMADVDYPARGSERGSARDAAVPETILRVGFEGGCMTIQGWQGDDGRGRFRFSADCSTFADLAPGEFTPDELRRNGEWTFEFERVLEELDRQHPWARLSPIQVHPEFSDRILEAVRSRLSTSGDRRGYRSSLERWQRACAETRSLR
jgi:hypothetical protein